MNVKISSTLILDGISPKLLLKASEEISLYYVVQIRCNYLLEYEHSNKGPCAIASHGAVYSDVHGGSNCCVCEPINNGYSVISY